LIQEVFISKKRKTPKNKQKQLSTATLCTTGDQIEPCYTQFMTGASADEEAFCKCVIALGGDAMDYWCNCATIYCDLAKQSNLDPGTCCGCYHENK